MTSGQLARAAAQLWPRYLDAEALIAYLSLGSSDGVYRLVRAGLPAIRLGRGPRARYRFDRLRVDAWMEERQLVASSHAPTVGAAGRSRHGADFTRSRAK